MVIIFSKSTNAWGFHGNLDEVDALYTVDNKLAILLKYVR